MLKRQLVTIIGCSVTTFAACVFMLGDVPKAHANTAGPNCAGYLDGFGNIVHSFDSSRHTMTQTCDADGAHNADKPDFCGEHHSCA